MAPPKVSRANGGAEAWGGKRFVHREEASLLAIAIAFFPPLVKTWKSRSALHVPSCPWP